MTVPGVESCCCCCCCCFLGLIAGRVFRASKEVLARWGELDRMGWDGIGEERRGLLGGGEDR